MVNRGAYKQLPSSVLNELRDRVDTEVVVDDRNRSIFCRLLTKRQARKANNRQSSFTTFLF